MIGHPTARAPAHGIWISSVGALLFAVSTAVTIVWCGSMSATGGMEMPGGWTMSMAWMRMPGQTWLDAGATFLGMWTVMMVAMMWPSLMPMLWRYRKTALGRNEVSTRKQLDSLTALVSGGYFFVWVLIGIAAFPLGIAVAEIEMRYATVARAVPMTAGVLVMLAGALQFTAWKARQLECCRKARGCGLDLPISATSAWRHGVQLGLQCAACCGTLMSVLLVIGMMDLRAMAAVTAAITLERLAPAGQRVAHAIGVVILGAGLFMIGQALLDL